MKKIYMFYKLLGRHQHTVEFVQTKMTPPFRYQGKNAMASTSTAQQWNAQIIGETPEITKAANLGKYLLVLMLCHVFS